MLRLSGTVTLFALCACCAFAQHTAQRSAPHKKAPRLVVPGAGAVAPRRTPPPAMPPALQPAPPAAVVIPGGSPSLPGLAGGFQVKALNPLIYGVNIAWNRDGGVRGWDKAGLAQPKQAIALLKSLGATNTAIEIRWDEIEAKRGQFVWGDLDRLVRFVLQNGIQPVAIVSGTPAWARVPGDDLPDLHYLPEFSRFISSCASRYRPTIRDWALGRAPDANTAWGSAPSTAQLGAHARLYGRLLVSFSNIVRRIVPGAHVAVGPLGRHDTEFMAALYRAGARGAFDAVGANPTLDTGLDAVWLDRLRAVMAANGDRNKVFWILGWGAGTGTAHVRLTSERQARLVREGLMVLRARPEVYMAQYAALVDDGVEGHGLTTRSLAPKPAFVAFRDVAAGQPAAFAESYQHVRLAGALPGADVDGVKAAAVNVTVDASQAAEAVNAVWRGFAQGPLPGGVPAFEEVASRLARVRARLVRFDPFPTPDMVTLAPDGAPSVNWTYADGVMAALHKADIAAVFDLSTVPSVYVDPATGGVAGERATAWARFIGLVAARYGGGARGRVAMWQFGGDTGSPAALQAWLHSYDLFARAVTAAAPGARVGGPSLARYAPDAVAQIARHCAEASVPLHFVAWHVYDAEPSTLVANTVAALDELHRYPALKNATVLVDEWNWHGKPSAEHDTLAAASHLANMADALSGARAVDALFYEPKEAVGNRTGGGTRWGGWGAIDGAGQAKPVYDAFALLARVEGRRAPVSSEDPAVRALAAMGENRASVLVWRAGDESGQRGDQPVHVRLRALPWRAGTLCKLTILSAGTAAGRVISGASGAPGGDLEVPVVLPAGGMALLELVQQKPAAITAQLDTPSYVAFAGGRFVLTALFTNRGTSAVQVRPEFSCTEPSLVPAARPATIRLAPGQMGKATFTVQAPLSAAGQQHFFTVKAGAAVASTAVRFARPLEFELVPPVVDLPKPDGTADRTDRVARVRAELINRADAVVYATITGAKTAENVRIAPRSATGVDLAVAAPTGAPGNYAVPLMATIGKVEAAGAVARLRVPMLCRRAPRKPRIDADLNEWVNAYAVPVVGGTGRAMAAGQALWMWDGEALYMAASVHTPVLAPGDRVRPADGIPMMLVVQPRFAPGGADGPKQFAVNLEGIRPELRAITPAGDFGAAVAGAAVAVRRMDDRTLYEVAIPWRALGVAAPQSGALMGAGVRMSVGDAGRRQSVSIGSGNDELLGLRFTR